MSLFIQLLDFLKSSRSALVKSNLNLVWQPVLTIANCQISIILRRSMQLLSKKRAVSAYLFELFFRAYISGV